MLPDGPATELTRMNSAETTAAVLVRAHLDLQPGAPPVAAGILPAVKGGILLPGAPVVAGYS
jgi:hypothetical protein